MTKREAIYRAGLIWGSVRIVDVGLRPDGGADVELAPTSSRVFGIVAREYAYHRIDQNGHAICHGDCESLERNGR